MKAHFETRRLYGVTVLGLTATMTGPADIAAMYRKVREVYPRDLSVEIRCLDDDVGLCHPTDEPTRKKVHSNHGYH